MIERYYMALDAGSAPPPIGFARTVILSSSLAVHCGNPTSTVYTAETTSTIAPTMELYWDDNLTVPVVTYSYVSDPANGTIYNLNPSTGIIGANTGQSC